jgi:hypothetical protein
MPIANIRAVRDEVVDVGGEATVKSPGKGGLVRADVVFASNNARPAVILVDDGPEETRQRVPGVDDVGIESGDVAGEGEIGEWVEGEAAVELDDAYAGGGEGLGDGLQSAGGPGGTEHRGAKGSDVNIVAVADERLAEKQELRLRSAAAEGINDVEDAAGHEQVAAAILQTTLRDVAQVGLKKGDS